MSLIRLAYSVLLPPLLCLASVSACADDGSISEAGGTASLVKKEDTHIVMKSEVVTMELDKDSYTVDATFDFVNEGDTTTLLVGFPRWGFNGIHDDTMAKSFETWVGGEKVPIRDVFGRLTVLAEGVPRDGSGAQIITDPAVIEKVTKDYEAFRDMFGPLFYVELRWFAKDVTFEGGKSTTTRVRFKELYRGDMCMYRNAHYMFGTGKSWKGNIGRAQFIIRLAAGMCMESHPRCVSINSYQDTDRKPVMERLGEYEFKYTLEDFEPKEDETLIVGFYQAEETWSTPWNACNDFKSDRADKPVDSMLLEVLPLDQLRLLRNAFLAVHGKKFEDAGPQKFFGAVDWYVPRDDFKYDDLTPVQKDNVERITAAERKLEALLRNKN